MGIFFFFDTFLTFFDPSPVLHVVSGDACRHHRCPRATEALGAGLRPYVAWWWCSVDFMVNFRDHGAMGVAPKNEWKWLVDNRKSHLEMVI